MPASLKKPPVGVGAAIVANSIVRRTPCSGVRTPVLPLMSVATKPGFIALTLIRVSRNSLAKAIMIALAAALNAEYAVRGQWSEPAQRIDQSRQRTHPRADHDDDLIASPFSNVGVAIHFRNWQQLFQHHKKCRIHAQIKISVRSLIRTFSACRRKKPRIDDAGLE
jgi:hypothetical protein